MIEVNESLPTQVVFPVRDEENRQGFKYKNKTAEELFSNKRVIIFGLPGAFTPTCSKSQLPAYEKRHDEFLSHGFDAIYCCSVNDTFVMEAWRKSKGVKKVKMLPDGSGTFTKAIGALVSKENIGFGPRSWRYCILVNNMQVEAVFVEDNQRDNAEDDPYLLSNPSYVLGHLRGKL